MKKSVVTGLAIAGSIALFIVIVIGFFASVNNRMVALDEGANAAWAQVETQLQRRYDLVPNLVETVKGYAAHEKDVLIAVTEARSRVGSASTVKDKIEANNGLGNAIGRLLVVMEKYPDLKADQNFLALQSQLEGTENRIAVERRRYNEAVQIYNTAIRSFPGGLFAGMKHFEKRVMFEATAGAEKAPSVKF